MFWITIVFLSSWSIDLCLSQVSLPILHSVSFYISYILKKLAGKEYGELTQYVWAIIRFAFSNSHPEIHTGRRA